MAWGRLETCGQCRQVAWPRRKGDNGACRPPFRLSAVDLETNRGHDQMNIRLVVQRKSRPMSWRRRGQGDKSPHGPPVRLVAGDLQTKHGHKQTNYCLE